MSEIKYVPDSAEIIQGPYLWWQKKGLSYTRTGYGSKIPTEWLVKWNGRTYRVYCSIHSNCGVLYIISKGQKYYVHGYNFPARK